MEAGRHGAAGRGRHRTISIGAFSRAPRNEVLRSMPARLVWINALLGQPVALQVGRHPLVFDRLEQAHVDLAAFAYLLAVTDSRGRSSSAAPETMAACQMPCGSHLRS